MQESSESVQWEQVARQRVQVSLRWGHGMAVGLLLLGSTALVLAKTDAAAWTRIKGVIIVALILVAVMTGMLYLRAVFLRRNLLTSTEIAALITERDRVGNRLFGESD